MGGRRGLVIEELGTRGVVAERFSLGSSRRLTLQGFVRRRSGREIREGHRPRMPHFQPRIAQIYE
jgi:hypothetical protein